MVLALLRDDLVHPKLLKWTPILVLREFSWPVLICIGLLLRYHAVPQALADSASLDAFAFSYHAPTNQLFCFASLHRMFLEELPHQVVGRNVFGRFTQCLEPWYLPRPCMPATFDFDQHDFCPILS